MALRESCALLGVCESAACGRLFCGWGSGVPRSRPWVAGGVLVDATAAWLLGAAGASGSWGVGGGSLVGVLWVRGSWFLFWLVGSCFL